MHCVCLHYTVAFFNNAHSFALCGGHWFVSVLRQNVGNLYSLFYYIETEIITTFLALTMCMRPKRKNLPTPGAILVSRVHIYLTLTLTLWLYTYDRARQSLFFLGIITILLNYKPLLFIKKKEKEYIVWFTILVFGYRSNLNWMCGHNP